ncbi:hypothetical protein [Fulvivirga ligni]|uniref:hypothetical protein n=1 Tax=Fulvivirga ligni TaxID=2904246 RepID=UPI001F3A239D|nr:hypothetical protein [Fulvivirga ligni]UII20154.1 hypothetical protein LVD16_20110 [Fulvivirga ligni]
MRISLFLILFIAAMGCTENVSEQQQESLDALENRYVQFYNEKAEEYLFGTGIEVYGKGQRKADMKVLKEAESFIDMKDTVICALGRQLSEAIGKSLSDSLRNNCDDELLKSSVRERFLASCAEQMGSFCGFYRGYLSLFQTTASGEILKIGIAGVKFRNKNGDELKWLERNLDNNCASWKLIAKESLYEN